MSGLLSDIPYARTTKTGEELDAMSTAQVVALAVPTKDKQIDLIEYLERRWFAHRVMMDGNT